MRCVFPGEGRSRPGHHDAVAEQPTASLQTIQHTRWALMNAIHDALRRDLDQLTRATARRAASKWTDCPDRSSDRRRRVLPAAGRPGHRRHQPLQPKLQEWEDYYNYHRPPTAPDPLRTSTAESPRPAAPRTRVIELQATSAPPRRPSQVQITWRLQRSRPEADSRPARIGRSVAGPAATSASR